jgi:hypothetical protein
MRKYYPTSKPGQGADIYLLVDTKFRPVYMAACAMLDRRGCWIYPHSRKYCNWNTKFNLGWHFKSYFQFTEAMRELEKLGYVRADKFEDLMLPEPKLKSPKPEKQNPKEKIGTVFVVTVGRIVVGIRNTLGEAQKVANSKFRGLQQEIQEWQVGGSCMVNLWTRTEQSIEWIHTT